MADAATENAVQRALMESRRDAVCGPHPGWRCSEGEYAAWAEKVRVWEKAERKLGMYPVPLNRALQWWVDRGKPDLRNVGPKRRAVLEALASSLQRSFNWLGDDWLAQHAY